MWFYDMNINSEIPKSSSFSDLGKNIAYFIKYCDVHAVGNIACVDNRCYGNG
jgi:hypothetical protein